MRHESDDRARGIRDARDVAQAAVGVDLEIARDHQALALEPVQRLLVGDVAALAVLERDDDLLARGVGIGPCRVGALHAQALVAADEVQVVVAGESAGQQVRLAEDLESVADSEHGQALLGTGDDRGHHGREASDGTAAQVVAVRESSREHHRIDALEVVVAVPERHGITAREPHRARGIAIVQRTREGDDSDLHSSTRNS